MSALLQLAFLCNTDFVKYCGIIIVCGETIFILPTHAHDLRPNKRMTK